MSEKSGFSDKQFAQLRRALEYAGYTSRQLECLYYDCDGNFSYPLLTLVLKVIKGEADIITTLMKTVGTFHVPAVKKFVPKDVFREYSYSDGVRISTMCLRDNFLDKIEENVPYMDLNINEMMFWSHWDHIVHELEPYVETTLAHIFEMLKAQGEGQPGHLLTTDRGHGTNLFFVRDSKGELNFIDVLWDDGIGPYAHRGWRIGCGSGGFPEGQNKGCLVISPKP